MTRKPPLRGIVRNIVTQEATPLPEYCEVVFGEGADAITVSPSSGEVEVWGMRPIALLPRVANVVIVKPRRPEDAV